jgi:hypothetical protein
VTEPIQAAFFHPGRKQIFTGTILGRENVPCGDGVKTLSMFKIAYYDGKDKLVAFISPKNVIPFEA